MTRRKPAGFQGQEILDSPEAKTDLMGWKHDGIGAGGRGADTTWKAFVPIFQIRVPQGIRLPCAKAMHSIEQCQTLPMGV